MIIGLNKNSSGDLRALEKIINSLWPSPLLVQQLNKEEKELTDLEVSRLMFEPTTAKKRMDCPNKECNNKIISVMRDDEYNNYILGCRKCETIFHY